MAQGPGPHAPSFGPGPEGAPPDVGPDAHAHPQGASPGHGHAHDSDDAAHDHHGFAAAARAIGMRERRRRTLARARAVVLALGAALLVLELGLRASGWRERALDAALPRWSALAREHRLRSHPDPARRWALARARAGEIEVASLALSAQGTRADLAAPKPAGERRLLVLGESFATGVLVPESATLAARLAGRLAARFPGTTWRGISLGAPGYRLSQCLATLEEEGPALEPDAVLVLLGPDDLRPPLAWLDPPGVALQDALPLPSRLEALLLHTSHAYAWLALELARHSHPAPPLGARELERARLDLARLRELCRAHDWPVCVLLHPLDVVGASPAFEDWARAQCTPLGLPSVVVGDPGREPEATRMAAAEGRDGSQLDLARRLERAADGDLAARLDAALRALEWP